MKTFIEWEVFCEKLSDLKGVTFPVIRSIKGAKQGTGSMLAIKHDVEADAIKALELAKIEAKYNIKATYYFHGFFCKNKRDISIIQKIQDLGHEVGYHYDVLDSCDGDFNKATEEFESYMQSFASNNIVIRTICPHGNPLKKRQGWNSNKDFFKNENVQKIYGNLFDVVNCFGDTSFDYYISDAGYNFKIIGDIRDNDKVGRAADRYVAENEIFEMLKAKKKVILSVHPHRFSKSRLLVILKRYLFMFLRRGAQILMKSNLGKKIISPLFKLTKRF